MNRRLLPLVFAFCCFAWLSCEQVCQAQLSAKPFEAASHASFKPRELAKLAVIVSADDKNPDVPLDEARFVEDMFVEALLQKGHVVVAKSDIKPALQGLDLSKFALNDSTAVAVGKLIDVPAVLVIKIGDFSTKQQMDRRKGFQVSMAHTTISARLVDAESGTLWWQGNSSLAEPIKVRGEQLVVLAKTAEKLCTAFPEKSSENLNQIDPKNIQKLALIMVDQAPSLVMFPRAIGNRGAKNDKLVKTPSDSDHRRLVEDKFGFLLADKGYSLVTKPDLEAVAKEKPFQQSGLTEENATEFGKILDVPAVMFVRMTEYDAEKQKNTGRSSHTFAVAAIGVRVISVETGQVLWCRARTEEQEIQGAVVDTAPLFNKVVKKIGDLFPDGKLAKQSPATSSQ